VIGRAASKDQDRDGRIVPIDAKKLRCFIASERCEPNDVIRPQHAYPASRGPEGAPFLPEHQAAPRPPSSHRSDLDRLEEGCVIILGLVHTRGVIQFPDPSGALAPGDSLSGATTPIASNIGGGLFRRRPRQKSLIHRGAFGGRIGGHQRALGSMASALAV
jgi:hypothetical protein